MSLLESVDAAMALWPGASVGDGGHVVVPSHCLYPSNDVVRVWISGGRTAFQVHDNGGALDEFDSSGGHHSDAVYIIGTACKHLGLEVNRSGTIYSRPINLEQLPGAILLVANASKDAATALLSRFRPRPRKNFKEMLAKLIDAERVQGRFLDIAFQRPVVGISSKPHKFDFDIKLTLSTRLLLDGATPESGSINSVMAANVDVRQAEIPNLIQRIVYDDTDEWKSSDLNLLGLGATVVPFSKLKPVLERLAA